MRLGVYSEIGRLRQVMVHAPGPEIDQMPPSMMAELLFDDILHGPRARAEHQRFRAVMECFGVEVWDTQQLLAEALAAAADEHRAGLLLEIDDLEGLGSEVVAELRALPAPALARALVEGLPAQPPEREPDYLFRMTPLPNLMFTRDALVVLGDAVLIGAMSRPARQREPALGRFIFEHHPRLGGAPVLCDFGRRRRVAFPIGVTPTLEGGDVLVLQEGIVVLGLSERTMESAADVLTERLRGHERFHTLVLVPLPKARHAMHLDTVFTRIAEDQCLLYGPMLLPGGAESVSAISIDLGDPADWGTRRPSLLEALRRAGVELEPVLCGGSGDYIQQAREQWSDGANSFALAPGVVMVYQRNARTAEELGRRGYHLVSVDEMPFDSDGRCRYEFRPGKRYAILLPGEELSRARGGPRCMTMPLVREG
ncbi:MAG: arginine deiminase [Planctomycetota bacterium]|nr:MAG: arginine deiminase [Planctomycetota bacterium]